MGGYNIGNVPVVPYVLPENVVINTSITSVNVTDKGLPQCETGLVCNTTSAANCTDIQNAAIDFFKYGNIHDGLSCEGWNPYYSVCNQSYYCPDPATREPCPAGYFCPYKTAQPFIVCNNCPEGSEEIHRDTWGYFVMFIYFAFAIGYVVVMLLKRRFERVADEIERLKSRVVDIMDIEQHLVSKQDQLNRLAPKFEIILRRIESKKQNGSFEEEEEKAEEGADDGYYRAGSNIKCITIDSEGKVTFDVVGFFHLLDEDRSGTISYQELNTVLQFEPNELEEFIRRMQELGKESGDDISLKAFVKYFVTVLSEVANLQLTAEEAGSLWDEMAEKTREDPEVGRIHLRDLYHSSISKTTNDAQICEVIKKFRSPREDSEGKQGEAVTKDGKVSRAEFCEHFPKILNEVFVEGNSLIKCQVASSFDIAFRDLKLEIKAGKNQSVNVVDGVTGRIEGGKMTAVMGGSGAGKTSLLNALCGRAYYGDTSGEIFINGNPASIEDFSDSIGFVPQDDIVFPELTVKENFMFSGKFRLPRGTKQYEIEELAEEVMADLGLSRKASSLVGDVTRRGLSGGEKKRVNVGLEMMAQPSVLFLDEPTSGLDSSSAMLVMSSLKTLVKTKGVTVCAVIHQPRKFIFDLFDSLILLGDGGRMVYHGQVEEAEAYFSDLFYELPVGENVADWLIDISSGRIAPTKFSPKQDNESLEIGAGNAGNKTSDSPEKTSSHSGSRKGMRISALKGVVPTLLHRDITKEASDLTSSRGSSGIKEEKARHAAKLRREMLYENWDAHFDLLSPSKKVRYDPPVPSELPAENSKPTFLRQLVLQCQRITYLFWRNRVSKIIESSLIIFAVSLFTYLMGHLDPILGYFFDSKMVNIPFEAMVSGQAEVQEAFFENLFLGPGKGLDQCMLDYQFVGLVASLLLAIMATRSLTTHRLEFYREAGSGYDVNAYFLAVNIYTTVEQGIQVMLAAVLVVWLRHQIISPNITYLWFFLLMWITVSWALLIPLLVPPGSVMLVITLFTAICGVMFAGTFGLTTLQMYDSSIAAIFSAFFGSTRLFLESVVVSVYRCLPSQYGFTQSEEAVGFPESLNLFAVKGMGVNDSTVSEQDCDGWYWYVWSAILVGLTLRCCAFGVINTFNQSMQAKKSFWRKLRHNGSPRLYVETAIFWLVLIGLMVITCWSILRKN